MFSGPKIQDGKILLKNGSVTDCCCDEFELIITYDWAGTNLSDLDTSTRATWAISGNESHGFDCANQTIYMDWITLDDTLINGKEEVHVKIITAKNNGEWNNPASFNISLYAWWYPTFQQGSGNVKITAKLGEVTVEKNVLVSRRRNSNDQPPYCSPNPVTILTITQDYTLAFS